MLFNYTNSKLLGLSIHFIGNKNNEEGVHLSKTNVHHDSEELINILTDYFLSPFKSFEAYNFNHYSSLTMNEVYNYVDTIFEDKLQLHPMSINIAKQLYEKSNHSKILAGELYVSHFNNIIYNDEVVDAIVIVKSETKDTFLKVNQLESEFELNLEQGLNLSKIDKGCLILSNNKDNGYNVFIIDSKNSNDTQYWKDSFLQLKPCSNNYNHTKEFMNIAKNFVTKQLNEEFEVTKADQIDYLNRSVDYFKTNDTFDKQEFEQAVFKDEGVIESFRTFDEAYRMSNELDISDSFDISSQAVKKQARIFKSVLKLDKNFHIYIHGNRELIEQGVEPDGRKFYKLYFKEEE